MRGKRGRLVFTLVVLAALSAATGRARSSTSEPTVSASLVAQRSKVSAAATSKVEPLVDGEKSPELITDEVALRVFFLSTLVPLNPTATDTALFRAKVGRMNLEEADLTRLTQALGHLHALATPQRARIVATREAEKQNPTPATFARVAAQDGQLDIIAADTYRELLRSLSPTGAAKLRQHIAYVKTKVKVLPPPKMSMPHH